MTAQTGRKIVKIAGILLVFWLGLRYLLPVTIPFLLGGAIAVGAEPGVLLLEKRFRWRRFPAVAVCVSLTLVLLVTLISLVGAFAVKELGEVTKLVPQMGQTVGQGMLVLEDYLVTLADRAPESIRPVLIQTLMDNFQDGTALVNQVTQKLPGVMADVIGKLSKGALTVGTGILASYMISARLPRIRKWFRQQLPASWTDRILPMLTEVKSTFGGWLRAQLKLMLLTWVIVGGGLTLLKIPNGFLWALLVAAVDAVPVLGSGTVLIPWAIISFLQGDTLQGGGLLGVSVAAVIGRTVLEPRIVGKSLGLDPLLSLGAVYIGFQVWGIPGIILAPVAAALLKSVINSSANHNSQIIHKETS